MLINGSKEGVPLRRRWLHDGSIPGSELPPRAAALEGGAVAAAAAALGERSAADLEFLLRPDSALLDGRYANNGWLQECPRTTCWVGTPENGGAMRIDDPSPSSTTTRRARSL